jgi:hypothetical protein
MHMWTNYESRPNGTLSKEKQQDGPTSLLGMTAAGSAGFYVACTFLQGVLQVIAPFHHFQR